MNRHRGEPFDERPRGSQRAHERDALGAYAFGLLDDRQSRAVETHLAGCPACRHEWEELRGMVDLLDDVPPEAFLDGPPDAELLLRRTLHQVRAEATGRRRRRRLLTGAAAAGLVAAVLGGGVLIGRQTAPPPTVAAAPAPTGEAVVMFGTGVPGVSMTTTMRPAAGWVRMSTTVAGIPAGERCRVVVVTGDGTRLVTGSWLVPPDGWREGVTVDGSALVPFDQVAAVVVENEAGREFATARG